MGGKAQSTYATNDQLMLTVVLRALVRLSRWRGRVGGRIIPLRSRGHTLAVGDIAREGRDHMRAHPSLVIVSAGSLALTAILRFV